MATFITPEQLAVLSNCDCEYKAKATYYCNVEKCPFNKIRPIYCENCMCDDIHSHLPAKIPALVTIESTKWMEVKQNLYKLHDAATRSSVQHASLI